MSSYCKYKNIFFYKYKKYLFLNQTTFFLVIVFLGFWKNIPTQLLMYLKRNNNSSPYGNVNFVYYIIASRLKVKKINQNTCFSQDGNCFYLRSFLFPGRKFLRGRKILRGRFLFEVGSFSEVGF